jgi:hypothetical protein
MCFSKACGSRAWQQFPRYHAMKYKQAMKSNYKKLWIKVVDEEHGKKYKAFKAVKKNTLPKDVKVLSSTGGKEEKVEQNLLCSSDRTRI